MSDNDTPTLETIKELKHASISLIKGEKSIFLVTAETRYIPINHFKNVFNEIGQLVEKYSVKKLIFDKRKLNVFHQPSMEWYFVEWKSQMLDLGLTRHVKILPIDEVFRQSVKIGRRKIDESFPNGRFHQLEILYAESLEEAILL